MSETTIHPATPTHLWLPPERMRRYQWVKVVGGVLIGVIFAGWLFIQWSNAVMRIVAAGLLLVTVWVIAGSIWDDVVRSRGRQVSLEGDTLVIQADGQVQRVDLSEIGHAEWSEDRAEESGLLLFDRAGRPLALLDSYLLADQAEARAFVHWVRERVPFDFEIRWNPVTRSDGSP